jgi:polysaccharide biosynthesis/export protein
MRNLLGFLSIILILSSCNQYKRFTYLQPPPLSNDSFYTNKLIPYKIQNSDNLYVKISCPLNEASDKLFNPATNNITSTMGGTQGGSLYFMGNIVDNEGNINLPVIGKILVTGCTLEEVKAKIQEMVSKMSSDAIVDIKLLSFKISVLGEVGNPGQYTIYNDKANILEALAISGDLTYNGNRKKILILRSFVNGTQPIDIDLTKRTLLSSEKYYLMPNDIIYVEPYKTTAFRVRIAEYSQFLTFITSTITAIVLINNLK